MSLVVDIGHRKREKVLIDWSRIIFCS